MQKITSTFNFEKLDPRSCNPRNNQEKICLHNCSVLGGGMWNLKFAIAVGVAPLAMEGSTPSWPEELNPQAKSIPSSLIANPLFIPVPMKITFGSLFLVVLFPSDFLLVCHQDEAVGLLAQKEAFSCLFAQSHCFPRSLLSHPS
jgi:hypothetical protein